METRILPVTNAFTSCMCFILIFILPTICGHITYIEVKYPLKGSPSPPGSPWPLPQKWIKSDQRLTVHPDLFNIKLTKNSSDCDILFEAIDRARGNIFIDPSGRAEPNLTHIDDLYVDVDDNSCSYPKFGDDESYSIDIPFHGEVATIRAGTTWGAIRALETFSQLVYQNERRHYIINSTRINDWPEYKYRGLLIDTARHFIPVKVLLDNLDAMAYNKYNVFHWHIIDDQSFPLESRKYPNLTRLGAFSEDHVYTQEDIQRVIHEARLRGIRVIPEIDTPGHTQAFGKVFPDLLTTCYGTDGTPFTSIYGRHAKAEILNPIKNETYDFFKSFFEEVRSIFKDDYIHLGMDEVYYDCWESNPDIKQWMSDMKLTNISQVEQYYVRRTLKNVKDIGYKYITWQDPVDNGVKLADDAIVQVWKDTDLVSTFKPWQLYMPSIVREKYSVVLSSCWYLNYISYGEDWKKYYNCNPREFNGTDEDKSRVIGGEACMWGEFVDGTNILARLWPRASAVAERLWSNPNATSSTDDAQYRLDEHRCRMLRRGIPAQPILNGFCGDYDWQISSARRRNKLNLLLSSLSLVILLLFST